MGTLFVVSVAFIIIIFFFVVVRFSQDSHVNQVIPEGLHMEEKFKMSEGKHMEKNDKTSSSKTRIPC